MRGSGGTNRASASCVLVQIRIGALNRTPGFGTTLGDVSRITAVKTINRRSAGRRRSRVFWRTRRIRRDVSRIRNYDRSVERLRTAGRRSRRWLTFKMTRYRIRRVDGCKPFLAESTHSLPISQISEEVCSGRVRASECVNRKFLAK